MPKPFCSRENSSDGEYPMNRMYVPIRRGVSPLGDKNHLDGLSASRRSARSGLAMLTVTESNRHAASVEAAVCVRSPSWNATHRIICRLSSAVDSRFAVIQVRKTEPCLGPLWFWCLRFRVSAHSSRLHRGWPRAYPRSLARRALLPQVGRARLLSSGSYSQHRC